MWLFSWVFLRVYLHKSEHLSAYLNIEEKKGETGEWFYLIAVRFPLDIGVSHLGKSDNITIFLWTWKLRCHLNLVQLMPSLITMSVDHQSVATAPLDLSITARGQRSAGDLTFLAGDARATGGSPAPPASTGTDSSAAGRSPDTESTLLRKRAADSSPIKSPSKLPFRKRTFHVEPEVTPKPGAPTPATSAPSSSPAGEQKVRESAAFRLESATDESRIAVAPVTHRRTERAAHSPEGYSCCILPIINYGKRFCPTFTWLHFTSLISLYPVFEP